MMNDTRDMEIQSEQIDDALILRPIGDIDLGRAPALRVRLREAVQERPGRLIVDLDQVPYMDSSGLATLVEAMRSTQQAGSKLILCAMQHRVRSLMEIARLDLVFTIADSTEDALRAE